MAAPSDDPRDRLSRAMGAAFLAHQVSQLERSVETISFSRDARLYDIASSSARSGSRKGYNRKRDIRVVDASALVHALHVLKRWVREDTYLLVVPLEAFSILDILKKAPNPLHDLARDATRFLETQLDIARQIAGDSTFVRTDKMEYDPRIRLRAQTKEEELSWDLVQKRFRVPEGFVLPPPPPTTEEEEEEREQAIPTADDIPRHLRSTIQCALYFVTKYPATASLVVHNTSPDPSFPPPLLPFDHSRQGGLPDFLALSSGDAIWYPLTTFLSAEPHVILTSEIVAAREWFKAQAQAAAVAREAEAKSGGGKVRGGRGKGGRGEEGRGRGRGASRGEERGRGKATQLFVP